LVATSGPAFADSLAVCVQYSLIGVCYRFDVHGVNGAVLRKHVQLVTASGGKKVGVLGVNEPISLLQSHQLRAHITGPSLGSVSMRRDKAQ
jgi:hypothetical protein